jgi:lipopolysaccharide/colanic/teichoic acid biosynthesis glycosyltransferase
VLDSADDADRVRNEDLAMDAKRAFDLTAGSLALVVAAPILAVVAVAMRLSGDRGPFLHRARRVGEGGTLITVLKVRTMRAGVGGSTLTLADDPRVTRLGRFIRRYRIDELPQLVNVLRGEMSLVGPRPEDPRFVDLSIPLHRRVFTARPGITGPTQLAFRDESAWLVGPDAERRYRDEILPAKLRVDADYLSRRSTMLDLRILARTVGVVIGSHGVPRPLRQ